MLFEKLFVRSKFHRTFFPFIAHAFNAVDVDRLRLVGADRLCAEWILKNSGAVRLSIDLQYLLNDYNGLPSVQIPFQIIEIDATGASITDRGFDHLKDCDHISRIVLNECNSVGDEAINKLKYVKNSLHHLQISKCPGITAAGLSFVKDLSNLKEFVSFDLKIENESIQHKLKTALPKCKFYIN